MSRVDVLYFQEDEQTVPLVQWLDDIPARARRKCLARLQRLGELGHLMRRPEADYLRDDISELRASCQEVHYRMLYFFRGRLAVVVSHGIVKERAVPPREIDLAVKRKKTFESDPDKHGFQGR